MIKKLEIACFNAESAISAIEAGADRIEFCADYSSGGITPSVNGFKQIRNIAAIPVYVMIRPRPGDFVYSYNEVLKMREEIKSFSGEGADGFVFGILNKDMTVNKEYCCELLQYTGNHNCTFHRAFDRCNDSFVAADTIISCGFSSILTSGREKSAINGAEILNSIIRYSDSRISIIAGGGVRSSNIEELCRRAGTEFYHSSGIITGEEADRSEIKNMKEILKKCSLK